MFRYPHFSAVLSALSSNDVKISQSTEGDAVEVDTPPDRDMLQRLFYSCQGKDILAKVNLESGTGKKELGLRACLLSRICLSDIFLIIYLCVHVGIDPIATDQVNTFQHSGHLLMYWSLWEVARYCVLSRLRTPYGGPQQTLDALEKQLNSLLQPEEKETAGLQRYYISCFSYPEWFSVDVLEVSC